MNWLLLSHQIPPTPAYFRAKVLRRLGQVGALPIKNSVYLLPDTEDAREDCEWLCREITAEGGAAWLFKAQALVGLSDEEAVRAFRSLRDRDYAELLAAAPQLDDARLAQRFEEIRKIDFFDHPDGVQAALIIAERKRLADGGAAKSTPLDSGRTWVTRRGIKVDRMGSAWLIQRFIDPHATFRFVDTATYIHVAGELRFDMFEGEFTHEGDLCTFEVLASRHGLDIEFPALGPLSEMVHDIDLKDQKYQRPETAGLSRMLDGICAGTTDDEVRLARATQIFEALYQSLPI